VGKELTTHDTPCDYDNDGFLNVSDVVKMINDISALSYHFTIGYPTIATNVTVPNSRLEFYNGTNGNYNPEDAWTYKPVAGNPPLSQVQSHNNTYIQNVDVVGANPTKYYRTVTTQEVCRLTSSTNEYIVPEGNALNCNDYTQAHIGGAPKSKKVGVLVTSEVRWPTPTSSTKAVYRELLYDWISF
jgi:hypothetical protein